MTVRDIMRKATLPRRDAREVLLSTDVLIGLREVADSLGVSADAIAREVGLDPGVMDIRGGYAEWRRMALLRERIAQQARCPHFGLLVLARQPPLNIGVIGHLARSAPDFGTALRLLQKYMRTFNGALLWHIAEADDDDIVHISSQQVGVGPEEMIQAYIMGVGGAVMSVREIAGGHWQPLHVSFAFAPPRDTAPFRQFFGVPVHFRQQYSGFAIRSRDLVLPLATRDDQLHAVLLEHAESIHAALGSSDVVEQVRALLRRFVGTPGCSARGIAASLGMHPKTLQRRLLDRGVRFRSLLQEVRYEIARRHIEMRDASLSEIAELIGVSDGSAVSRGFREHFGAPPAAWRRTQGTRSLPVRSASMRGSRTVKRTRPATPPRAK